MHLVSSLTLVLSTCTLTLADPFGASADAPEPPPFYADLNPTTAERHPWCSNPMDRTRTFYLVGGPFSNWWDFSSSESTLRTTGDRQDAVDGAREKCERDCRKTSGGKCMLATFPPNGYSDSMAYWRCCPLVKSSGKEDKPRKGLARD